jgi:hypothetical protein
MQGIGLNGFILTPIQRLSVNDNYYIVIKDQIMSRNRVNDPNVLHGIFLRHDNNGNAIFSINNQEQTFSDDDKDFYSELQIQPVNLFGARQQNGNGGPPAGADPNTEMNAWINLPNLPRQGPHGPSEIPGGSPGRGGSRNRRHNKSKSRKQQLKRKDRKTRQRRQRSNRTRRLH